MPTISEFFGILIRMYYDDHNPPHFHVIYGEHEAQICINTLEILKGKLPKRVLAMVIEWAIEHRTELSADWQLAELHKPLCKIEPLE
ncbi:MAG: DUF4160 domain-containing protein [Oceanospirillaceae bacterium]|nr:DUF4160 domain-containing protein [Oceanospirillaceae bacterium]